MLTVPAFTISGYQVGISEIMLALLGIFVLALIVRNIIITQSGRKDD